MIVIDNFLPDIKLAQKLIADVEFGDCGYLGKVYSGFSQVTLPVKLLIEEVVGPISIRLSHLRKGTKATPLTHYIHADSYGASMGFVLCLSAPACQTGTAFWTHKETNLHKLPVPTPPDLFEYLDKEIKDVSKWEMTSMVEAKENRALIFESSLFHSRWPEVLPIEEGEKPRIVCTVFFDKL